MLKPTAPRFGEATVLQTEALSPHMSRITFRADLAAGFPDTIAGGYLKLLVPSPGEPAAPELDPATAKTLMRTYTLRDVRPSDSTFDIDFVVHGDEGNAGPWAAKARPGDRILISQPAPLKYSMAGADWHLFAADMSAIPAAAVALEALDPAATGDAFFEILSEDDRQPVNAPDGIQVHWMVKSDPRAPSDALIRAVRNAPWRPGTPGVFAAGEFSLIGDLRTYFRKERQTPKDLTYISSYWKLGLVEPEHKAFKAQAAQDRPVSRPPAP